MIYHQIMPHYIETASMTTSHAAEERTAKEKEMYICYLNYIKQKHKGQKRQYRSIAAELAQKRADNYQEEL